LVSFNDYPLGDPNAATPTAGSAATGGSGGTSHGGESVLPKGGSEAMPSGGSTSGPEGGSADPGGGSTALGPNLHLVDDFEDGDGAIFPQEGRSGDWYGANDGKGTQTPAGADDFVPSLLTPARNRSQHAAHTFGGPFSVWGAVFGTAFASNGLKDLPYDASKYQGLKFWVRSGATSATAAKQVRVNLTTTATNMGGGCTVCNDHFGRDVPLTANWTQITLQFSSIKQGGWGRPQQPAPNLTQLVAIQFLFPANISFDLWLDDVELY
jgi:hypothetical protein